MKKANLLCCLGLLLLSACRSDEKSTQASQERSPEKVVVFPGPEVTTIDFSRKDTVLGYTLDIKYPAIREHEVFNAAVRSNLEAAINEFITFIKDFEGEGRVLTSEYKLIRNTSLATSVRQQYEWAVPGVSTLQYRFHNVNYNPETKHLISLGSLFQEGAAYQPLLRNKLAEKISTRFEVTPDITNEDLQTFVIGPDYLEFYKVLYPDVMDPAPKAFKVMFSELGDVLK